MPKKGGKKNNAPKIEVEKPKETGAEQLARLRNMTKPNHKAQTWFYLAAGTLTVIITTLWGYSMYARLMAFELKKTDESKLVAENKQTWKEIFETVNGKNSTAEIKTKLQTTLAELKKAAAENVLAASSSLILSEEATTTEIDATSTINLSTTTANS